MLFMMEGLRYSVMVNPCTKHTCATAKRNRNFNGLVSSGKKKGSKNINAKKHDVHIKSSTDICKGFQLHAITMGVNTNIATSYGDEYPCQLDNAFNTFAV